MRFLRRSLILRANDRERIDRRRRCPFLGASAARSQQEGRTLARQRTTYDKFRKERARKEKKQKKAEDKVTKKELKGTEDGESRIDRELAEIVPGPQPGPFHE